MSEEFDTRYNFKETDEKIYKLWEENGCFNPDNLKNKKKKYSIHLPPPNITGSLHMGHTLNAAISDVLIRYFRMRGYQTVWFPGIDHAGIATQNVVEKELKKEGLTRKELGREKFLERVWQWKEKYGDIILNQLRKLGCALDWSRTRFTLDSNYAKEVIDAFIHYYEKGWIYQGIRVINWCPRCETSISDLEVKYQEEETKLYYLRYPLEEGGFILVATVRPESMLGDAAVAVHPQDIRYKKIIGKTAILPIKNIKIPVIADSQIDPEFGTGAVKVTPAHDILDYEIAVRHNLPLYKVIGEDGRMTKEAGEEFSGLKVKEAREKVVEELKKLGLLDKEEKYQHRLAVCERCETTIEPLPSKQWFLKMEELAKLAIEAVKSGKVKITPKNFEIPYFNWLENIKDWCISRQLWWGHRLPVYFCNKDEEKFIVSKTKPKICPMCKKCNMRQSEDVLDTWFSSALWPFAGLSKKDIAQFYPSNVLITDRGILNLWVARMIFSGLEFKKEIPFYEVLIHATVLTKEGKRMSKSKGTGIDPMDYLEQYGADATRFAILWQATGLQDIRWDESTAQTGRKFITKLWNIARYIHRRTNGEYVRGTSKKEIDLEIKEELKSTIAKIEEELKRYRFGQALSTIYHFIWHRFADKYIEETKKREDKEAKATLCLVLFSIVKILHPFLPFVTEEIYQKFFPGRILLNEKWPLIK